MDVQTPEAVEPSQGASFGEIAAHTEAASAATPEGEAQTAVTEDSQLIEADPPDLPGILKEPSKEEDDDNDNDNKPDLSLDADLENHPILKAKWEAYKAQKEKGINEFISKHNAELKELRQHRDEWSPLVEFYNRFDDPEQVDAAFAELVEGLQEAYNRPFGYTDKRSQSQDTQDISQRMVDEYGDPVSRYGLAVHTDDLVVDVVLKAMRAELDERFGKLDPLVKSVESQNQAEARNSKAQAALPAIKAEVEISSKPWVTPEMVAEAMAQYPSLEPADAFHLKYKREVAKYLHENSQGRSPGVKPLPQQEVGVRHSDGLRVGATFGEINRTTAQLG